MCSIPQVLRQICNEGMRLRLLITKIWRARQLFNLLSYLYIYGLHPFHFHCEKLELGLSSLLSFTIEWLYNSTQCIGSIQYLYTYHPSFRI